MPLKQAWRALTTVAEIAVFLWRRYNSAPASEPEATRASEATPSTREALVAAADDVTETAPSAEPTHTIRFGLDGQEYEIDLSDENATELREAFRRYIDAGRRSGPPPKTPITEPPARRTAQRSSAAGPDTATIREWARAHGHQVSDRGPIPTKVRQAYAARRRGRVG